MLWFICFNFFLMKNAGILSLFARVFMKWLLDLILEDRWAFGFQASWMQIIDLTVLFFDGNHWCVKSFMQKCKRLKKVKITFISHVNFQDLLTTMGTKWKTLFSYFDTKFFLFIHHKNCSKLLPVLNVQSTYFKSDWEETFALQVQIFGWIMFQKMWRSFDWLLL